MSNLKKENIEKENEKTLEIPVEQKPVDEKPIEKSQEQLALELTEILTNFENENKCQVIAMAFLSVVQCQAIGVAPGAQIYGDIRVIKGERKNVRM